MRAHLLLLLVLVACNNHSKSTSNKPKPTTPPVTPAPERPTPSPQIPETSPPAPPEQRPEAPRVRPEEVNVINDLKPTMYYVAQEEDTSCAGRYRGETFNGSEKKAVRDLQGRVLATVCARFGKVMDMEGTAILRDRGQGPVTLNFAGRVNGEIRYREMDRCKFGEGVRPNLCLLPYHTIAADNTVHKIDEIIFIPDAVGLALPDGSTHEGFFIVRDTGGAFNGIGPQRIDLFTGLDRDLDNVFSRAGFNHNRPMEAFKVKGVSADIIRERLKVKFGDLY